MDEPINSRSLGLLFVLSVSTVAALAPAASATGGVVAPRIVNADGPVDDTHATPWQVALVPRNSSGTAIQSAVFCGGTVRDNLHIVTAAHCLEETNPEDIAIVAGMRNRTSSSESTRQVETVAAITNDVDYNSATSENDVAVLTLDAPGLTLDPNVAAMPVVSQATTHEQLTDGTVEAAISGWGLTDPDNPNSQPAALLQAIIDVYDDSKCDNYDELFNPAVMLCAGRDTPPPVVDTCQGDSGGPLARRSGTTGWTFDALIGIVSFGIGCADPDFPGVYTDLSNDDIHAVATGPAPPRPTYSSTPTISGTARVGETLTCNPGSWTGNPTISFLWIAVPFDANGDPDFDNAFAVGDEQQLPLIPEDEGKAMLCIVRAQNSGGWVELADAVGPVEGLGAPPPPPPSVDVTRPTAGFTSRRCVRRTCRLTVLVNDIGGVQGMRVRASVRRLNCPRGRRGRRCRRPRSLRARQAAPGIFRIVARRLRPGRYRFRATAIDAAGNRSRPTTVVLRVKRRR